MKKSWSFRSSMVVVTHSEMQFGDFDSDSYYDIEQCNIYIKALGYGLKTVEFVLLKDALCFVEAKPSVPADFKQFISELVQKFKDSLVLFLALHLKRHEGEVLPENLANVAISKVPMTFVLVLKRTTKQDLITTTNPLKYITSDWITNSINNIKSNINININMNININLVTILKTHKHQHQITSNSNVIII